MLSSVVIVFSVMLYSFIIGFAAFSNRAQHPRYQQLLKLLKLLKLQKATCIRRSGRVPAAARGANGMARAALSEPLRRSIFWGGYSVLVMYSVLLVSSIRSITLYGVLLLSPL